MRPSWIGLGFVGLTQLSARWRPALWRWLYDRLAKSDARGELLFMNYGYADADDNRALVLIPQDEPFRYPIQLYAHAVDGVNLLGKDVVEVGCGRGGGGSFLIRHYQPSSYTGVDLSDAAIKWCRDHHRFPQARWLSGRADALPISSASADVVVNVESSHCYPSMADFVHEVTRVLRPGGYFALCDLRSPEGLAELASCLAASGLKQRRQRDITSDVVRALDSLSDTRAHLVGRVPPILRAAIRDFVGLKGSAMYEMLATGGLGYVSYLLQRGSFREGQANQAIARSTHLPLDY
jgi:SAM-dependent methyltransferase